MSTFHIDAVIEAWQLHDFEPSFKDLTIIRDEMYKLLLLKEQFAEMTNVTTTTSVGHLI